MFSKTVGYIIDEEVAFDSFSGSAQADFTLVLGKDFDGRIVRGNSVE